MFEDNNELEIIIFYIHFNRYFKKIMFFFVCVQRSINKQKYYTLLKIQVLTKSKFEEVLLMIFDKKKGYFGLF